jgi:EmrB/QacA subfamily drug resistance transporter
MAVEQMEAPGAAGASFQTLPRRAVVLTMVGLLLGVLLAALDQTIVGTAMPRVIAELNGFEQYAWVAVAYLVASTTMVPIFGKLSDLYGRKWFYVSGVVIFLVGSILCGASQSMTQLIVFRGLQGIGAGIMQAIAFVVIADLFPPAQIGRFQGLFAGVFGLASVIGPALGGFLTDNWGWRWVFYVNLPVGLLALGALVAFFPSIRPVGVRRTIDYLGVATLVLWVVPLLLGLTWGGSEYPWDSPQILGLFGFALVMLAAFLVIERRVPEPILSLGFFRNPIYSVSMGVVFLVAIAMFGTILFIPLFIQGVIPGATATSSGAIITPMMFSFIGSSIVAGQLLTRWGRYRIVAIVAMAVMIAGMFSLSRLNAASSYGDVLLGMVLVGIGIGASMPIYTVVVQNAMPPSVLGAATSSLQFFRSMGATMGTAIMGTLLTNNYRAAIQAHLPEQVRSAVPAERLAFLENPQIVQSPQAMAQVRETFAALPGGGPLLEAITGAIRIALATSIQQIFLMGLGVAVLAFVLNLFLREIPLRKTRLAPGEGEGAAVAEPVGAGPAR